MNWESGKNPPPDQDMAVKGEQGEQLDHIVTFGVLHKLKLKEFRKYFRSL